MDIESRKQLFKSIVDKVKLYKIAIDETPKIERIDDISVNDMSIFKNGTLFVGWYDSTYDLDKQCAPVGEIWHKFVSHMTGVFMSDEDALAAAKKELVEDLDCRIAEAKQDLSRLEDRKRSLTLRLPRL